ncbi:hypothetical protein B0T19DRAFT_421634 [Cercophora scortea]|uniref:Uncharacterized protein n=1 Tax=Cercophora scortea TaxID=314031 RepID=A0AAE0ILS5_9PEZI|nr:hypothetical protein B0T19DRAFT_421634 [Cercophora scortea]
MGVYAHVYLALTDFPVSTAAPGHTSFTTTQTETNTPCGMGGNKTIYSASAQPASRDPLTAVIHNKKVKEKADLTLEKHRCPSIPYR